MYSMSGIIRRSFASAVVAMLAFTAAAQAGDKKPKKASQGWTFEVSPYLWVTGVSGTVGVPGLPPTDIDLTFNQIIDHIDWPHALFFAAEARSPDGRWGIFNDLNYVKLEGEATGPRGHITANLSETLLIDTVEGGYRFLDDPAVKLDGMAGARIVYADTQLDLVGNGPLALSRSGEASDTWVDPVIAVRGTVRLGSSGFSLHAYGDVGGFGMNGDLTWQLIGDVDYDFNNWISAYAGIRYLNIQHDNNGFIFDVVEEGPILGATLHF